MWISQGAKHILSICYPRHRADFPLSQAIHFYLAYVQAITLLHMVDLQLFRPPTWVILCSCPRQIWYCYGRTLVMFVPCHIALGGLCLIPCHFTFCLGRTLLMFVPYSLGGLHTMSSHCLGADFVLCHAILYFVGRTWLDFMPSNMGRTLPLLMPLLGRVYLHPCHSNFLPRQTCLWLVPLFLLHGGLGWSFCHWFCSSFPLLVRICLPSMPPWILTSILRQICHDFQSFSDFF